MTLDSLTPDAAKKEEDLRHEICTIGRWMYERGFIVACEGNLSIRLDDGHILTTPTCMNKGSLSPNDLVIIGLGQVPLVRYATPGTPELSLALEPYVLHYDALLLANHGAVTCGPDLLTAYFRMETIEHFAKITLAAELAGGPILLSSCEVAKLMAARARYSVSTPPGGGG